MWKDPIVEEIQKYRDEYAKQFNYDFHAICQDYETETRSIWAASGYFETSSGKTRAKSHLGTRLLSLPICH